MTTLASTDINPLELVLHLLEVGSPLRVLLQAAGAGEGEVPAVCATDSRERLLCAHRLLPVYQSRAGAHPSASFLLLAAPAQDLLLWVDSGGTWVHHIGDPGHSLYIGQHGGEVAESAQ